MVGDFRKTTGSCLDRVGKENNRTFLKTGFGAIIAICGFIRLVTIRLPIAEGILFEALLRLMIKVFY